MSGPATYAEPPVPAFLFDLDGTLIDSVYQHVIAWQQALSEAGIDLSVWRIHRRIGMSGGLFVSALIRETGAVLSEADVESLQQAHAREYLKRADTVRPLPGAAELLAALTDRGVRWAIATSRHHPNLRHRSGQDHGKRGEPTPAPDAVSFGSALGRAWTVSSKSGRSAVRRAPGYSDPMCEMTSWPAMELSSPALGSNGAGVRKCP